MSRRIITEETQGAGDGETVDGYIDRVLKYIPADVVAAWLFLAGIIAGVDSLSKKRVLMWIVFAALIPLAILWTLRRTQKPGLPPAIAQSLIAGVSFIVWVFAIGGPFALYDFYDAIYGSILIVLYTLAIGLVIPPEEMPSANAPEPQPADSP